MTQSEIIEQKNALDGEEPRPMPESDEVKRFHDRIKRKQLYTRK